MLMTVPKSPKISRQTHNIARGQVYIHGNQIIPHNIKIRKIIQQWENGWEWKKKRKDLNDATSDKPKFMLKLSRVELDRTFLCATREHFISSFIISRNPDTFHLRFKWRRKFKILWKEINLMCHQKINKCELSWWSRAYVNGNEILVFFCNLAKKINNHVSLSSG